MTDNSLQRITRAQAGDVQAFADLFGQFKNLVFRTAYLSLGDASEAENALQEVFILVHRYLPSYNPQKGAFTTWLYRITMNYCVNHHHRRRPGSISLDGIGLSNEFPEARLAEEEALWQAIHRLSRKQRVVIVLRYYSELPYSDIAQILDIPLGTVKSRLDLALKTLRKTLDEQETAFGRDQEVEVSS